MNELEKWWEKAKKVELLDEADFFPSSVLVATRGIIARTTEIRSIEAKHLDFDQPELTQAPGELRDRRAAKEKSSDASQ